MNKHYVIVKKLSDDIEEEVTLDLNGLELTCFASICPNRVFEGKRYLVSFELMIVDEYLVEESADPTPSLERIGNGFSYWISGKLDGAIINSVVQFEDEILLLDYGYLNNKNIRMKVDRIDVEFLED